MSNRFVIIDTDIVSVEGQFSEYGSLFLHCVYKKNSFTKLEYRYCLDLWEEISSFLKGKAIFEVFSIVPHDSKTKKWQGLFGLNPIAEFENGVLFRRIL